jgi:serine/threonine protein kinase
MKPSPATSGLSREDFLQNLRQSGLLSEEEISRILATTPAGSAADGPALAGQLIAQGKLTDYQAEALLENRASELVLGNYEVLSRLGAGGMGTVFKARHRRMKRVVAIKVLSPAVAADGKFLQRFQREVETVARLSHPNIVMAFDADEAEAGPFLVMEFVNGRDLASRVQEGGPLPLADAVACALQAARGLAYAHAQNIIHRDVKPANLLLDASEVVKVADLGLARLSDSMAQPAEKSGSITQAGSVVGTVDFMPPEQAEDSTAIDHRADVYSLGCTLYFLLTGSPPYVGKSLMATLLAHRTAPIPSLCSARPEAPPALEALLRSMLAKLPAQRCPSMAEAVRALEALLPSLPNTPTPARGPAPAVSSIGGATVALRPLDPLTSSPALTLRETTVSGPRALEDDRPSTEVPVLAALTVLLVEPSRTQAVIVRKYLEDLGVEKVVTVPSGHKALEAILASPPRVVLCALHLDDMKGVHLARKVRGEPPLAGTGFILLSSESDSIDASSVLGLPRTVLLRKPFDLEQLKRALRQATS